MSSNRETWEEWGEHDPYFAVVTVDKFRAGNLDQDSRGAFFDTGRKHVDEIWPDLVEAAGGDFQPMTAVDYGCGVGRVLLPLAERCELVVGVDVSRRMLDEAGRNADLTGVSNAKFIDVQEFSGDRSAKFDLVHSYIVLQHIPPPEGYEIIAKLAERLSLGGVGMIHVTFRATGPALSRLRFKLYRDIPHLHRLLSKLRGRNEPFMPVYEYDLGRVRSVFAASGCTIHKEKDTDHGFLGKMFFIKRPANNEAGDRG